jgi:hypothetical protein
MHDKMTFLNHKNYNKVQLLLNYLPKFSYTQWALNHKSSSQYLGNFRAFISNLCPHHMDRPQWCSRSRFDQHFYYCTIIYSRRSEIINLMMDDGIE